MGRYIALGIFFLAAACVQTAPAHQDGERKPSTAWLVGGWVPEGESCESDAGVRYDADGTWASYEAAGTWRLQGSSLVSVITRAWTEGAEVPMLRPERHVERIEVLGPDKYRSRYEDGNVTTLVRCANWGS